MTKLRKGWFVIPGVQTGDRTILNQRRGLENVAFQKRTVLDCGIGEGLIAKYCLDRGASLVHGVDIIRENVFEAARQCRGERSHFWLLDLEQLPEHYHELHMLKTYDIILLLSVLHKLKNPEKLLHFCRKLSDQIIIRLPVPVLRDLRSGYRELDIKRYMTNAGFSLVDEPETSIEPVSGKHEWMSIWVRSIKG